MFCFINYYYYWFHLYCIIATVTDERSTWLATNRQLMSNSCLTVLELRW